MFRVQFPYFFLLTFALKTPLPLILLLMLSLALTWRSTTWSVAANLGLSDCGAFDISAACAGYCYAIGQAASLIVEAIVRDERRILPVSTARTDFHGIPKTAFSFPTIVGREGVVQVLKFSLSPEEDKLLLTSAKFVAENIAHAGY